VKEVVGSCVSMGVKVEGKDAREIMKEIDAGNWDSKFQ
jgi:large subunit ribosomal protein L11